MVIFFTGGCCGSHSDPSIWKKRQILIELIFIRQLIHTWGCGEEKQVSEKQEAGIFPCSQLSGQLLTWFRF